MDKTKIAWTDATWNPIRGCSRVSEGCRNCYAEAMAARFSGPGLPYEGLAADGRWTGKVRLVPKHLADPLRWRKPRRIFVNSMSDLFHEGLPDEYIDKVFAVMCIGNASPQHTFQILTKRPERMRAYMSDPKTPFRVHSQIVHDITVKGYYPNEGGCDWRATPWPPPRVWLGVSVEDQRTADERIRLLTETPAALRFVSAEPLLGPIDLRIDLSSWARPLMFGGEIVFHALDWVIVGGESGPKARPCDVGWIRQIVKDCAATKVPVFVKQLGSAPAVSGAEADCRHPTFKMLEFGLKDRKGGDPEEWPIDLRVRQFPEPNEA